MQLHVFFMRLTQESCRIVTMRMCPFFKENAVAPTLHERLVWRVTTEQKLQQHRVHMCQGFGFKLQRL